MTPSQYIHGTHEEEQFRLSLLNQILNDKEIHELALRGGEAILDVGCGLGQFSRLMARGAGRSVIGIERSEAQAARAIELAREAGEESMLEVRLGDAMKLPLGDDEEGSFDLVHSRFLLEHVPEPLEVVREMVRAARSGGRIVVADDDHDVMRLWPEVPGFYDLWREYMRVYERLGNDPRVGRCLVQLLHKAGASPLRATSIFFGSCSGEPIFATVIQNLIGIIAGAREALIEGGFDGGSFDGVIASLHEWSRRPDAALWYGMSWAEGVKP